MAGPFFMAVAWHRCSFDAAVCLLPPATCRCGARGDKIGMQNQFESIQLHEHQTTTRIYLD